MCPEISGDELPVGSPATVAVNQCGKSSNESVQEDVPLDSGGNDTVAEHVPLDLEEDALFDPAPERDTVRFFREGQEAFDQQRKEKDALEFEARRKEVGFFKAQDETVVAVANGMGKVINQMRDIVRSMDDDDSGDEGLISGGDRHRNLPSFDPDMPYRIELEVSEDMFAVVYHAKAADGTHVEGRDIQHADNLCSDAVAEHRARAAMCLACGGVTDDEVISVGSSGDDATTVNAAPSFDGFPVSPHSYEALMSTVVSTGVVTNLVTPTDRGHAKAAAGPDGHHKSSTEEPCVAGWETPPPAVRLSSPLVPKPVQAGEVRDGPSSCSST